MSLLEACTRKNEKRALKILSKCIKESLQERDRNGDTPLMIAIINNMASVVSKLLEQPKHCNINNKNNQNQSVLIYIFMSDLKSSDYIDILLEYCDKSLIGLPDIHGQTSIMLACYYGLSETALKLLEYIRHCNLSYVSYDCTALMYACNRKMIDVCLRMLEYPDLCNLNYTNKRSNNALEISKAKEIHVIIEKIKNTKILKK